MVTSLYNTILLCCNDRCDRLANRNEHDQVLPTEEATYCLGQLEDSPLPREKDGSGQDALHDFASNALVKTLDALLLNDGQEAVQRRLVFQASGLETALHNDVRIGKAGGS